MQDFWRRVAPPGSIRRLVGKMLSSLLRHPLRFFKKVTPRRLGVFFKILRTEGPTGVMRRVSQALVGNHVLSADLQILPTEDKAAIADYDKLVFPQDTTPLVSIIVPAYNHFAATYACLKSVLLHTRDIPYEVILADDASTDLTTQAAMVLENVCILHTEQNRGFLYNCNYAASCAKGRYLHFLNNDTQVQPDWLAPLVALLDEHPEIGLTGSKLVYPSGALQEAGGILWNDGSAWNYGNGSDPQLPEYNYVKDTDYISGASILVRTTLWQEIGGFDTRYAPAYCEDADLAMEIRKRGYRVVYQPASVVVHFEGTSHGTDLSAGTKAMQVANTQKLFAKWQEALQNGHYPPETELFSARDRSRTRKTLVMVDHYVPHYDSDAGSRSVMQYLEFFVAEGFNVKFIGDNFYPHQPYTGVLQQMGIEVLYGPHYAAHWRDWLADNAAAIDYVFLNRPHISVKYIDAVKTLPHAKIIYYGHDLHFLRETREYELTKSEKTLRSARRWKKQELELLHKVDMAYYPSSVEVDIIKSIDPEIPVKAVPVYIYEEREAARQNYRARHHLLFVGGFGHPPNIDAVHWLKSDILPLIHAKRPDIKVYVVGSHVPDTVAALASETFLLEGFVSDERLLELYQRCRMAIVPLRYGAGVKGKVVEAMLNQLPVLTTPIGAEGIPNAEKCLFVEQDADGLAASILSQYDDYAALEHVADAAFANVMQNFTVASVRRVIGPDFDILPERE